MSSSSQSFPIEVSSEAETCSAEEGKDTTDGPSLPSDPTSSVKEEDHSISAPTENEPEASDMEETDEMVVDDPLAIRDLQGSSTPSAGDDSGHDRHDDENNKTVALPATIKEEGVVDLLLVKTELQEKDKDTKDPLVVPADAARDLITPKVEELSTVAVVKAELTPQVVVNAPPKPEMLARAPDNLSAIHSLRGFLDVGSAALFAPSEPWVLATASLLTKRKLSKSSR